MGAGPNVNIAFGISTMLIAVPTGVKIFNWLFTMYRGRIRFTTPMYWTLAFLVTFAVGGMTGVLMSLPPADYVVHNSLFLVGHFHNVLIPGALFGYFAGFAYWFPKATGFRLNEKWGKRAFWCWLIGFYLAFSPLYVLGFMGMARRLAHYDNPAWQPYLIIAAGGTAVILLGIFMQIIQLVVSIRERHASLDHTGDPWDGRTLEWATSAPPAPYNFAPIPVVHDLDAFTDMKERGVVHPRPTRYQDIAMPRNTAVGFILGTLAFVFGFAMIWYIWWLAIVAALAVLATVVARSFNDDIEYVIPAPEVERIENERRGRMEQAAQRPAPAGAISQPAQV
jgi:cytochrome o ubiquinol oxidase subunit 1